MQVGRYTTTALFAGMQLSSGSTAAAKGSCPRCHCLLGDLCIMVLTVAERARPRQFFACPGPGGLRRSR